MPLALKASWTVRAGLTPGSPLLAFTKRWEYTSVDKAKDDQIREPHEHAIFSKLRAEALDYYLQMSQPHISNWAELVFIWY
jgi:hypothetical protein